MTAARREMPDLLGPLQLADGGLGFGQEQPSHLCERYCGPLVTVQQTSAERLLQPLDLQADGGLCHVQPVSGACEAELFGDGYEIAELASVKRDSAAGEGFGNAGVRHSINAQRRVKRAASHIFGVLQRIRIGCNHRVLDVLLGQVASRLVIVKISIDHRASSGYSVVP
jgi:hypothetical protein